MSGVTQGATAFASSVASGITGVVSKPLEGAEKEGVSGFFKGLGKGIVGYCFDLTIDFNLAV